mgnify:CR=1 FL=1
MTPRNTRIKICGNTRVGDALLAERLGADFIGLIFARQSPRHVSVDRAHAIAASLSRARPVGVFVDQDYEETLEIAEKCGLWGIQHYRNFPEGFRDFTYILGLRMGEPGMDDPNWPDDWASLACDYLLIDTYDKKAHGGTGKTFDWDRIPAMARDRTFLAGGLGPHNICAAAKQGVYALDLSSSVETSPGIKDPDQLEILFSTFQICDDMDQN